MGEKFNVKALEISIPEAARVLRGAFTYKGRTQPICLCGKPGIGKSQIVQQVCAEFGVSYENKNYHEIRAALVVDSSDLMGLPIVNKKLATENGVTKEFDPSMKYSTPDLLPIKKPGMSKEELEKLHVIFFDEINRSSDPAVMNAIFQLTTEHRVGPHELLDNTVIILALNPEAEGYLVNNMDPALINRINFQFVNCDFHNWKKFAVTHNIHPGIVEFLEANPNQLSHDGILRHEGQDKRFPSPRAWANVSKACDVYQFDFATSDKAELDLAFKIVAGIVGYSAATMFVDFMRTQYDDRPIPGDKIMAQYLLSSSMQNKVKATDSTGARLYDTTKVQVSIQGITDILKERKESIKVKELQNILAFLCDIPVEQSMSFQNMLTTDISSDFTNWFFTKVASKTELNKLWVALQNKTKKFSSGRKASEI